MDYGQLYGQIRRKRSFLCVGLDTDIAKLPESVKRLSHPQFEFNKRIVEATERYAVAYKLNTAFYESRGAAGWQALEATAEYIHATYPDVFLIADAKRGDIGNTAAMYAQAFFGRMCFDAVTVSPYMGGDTVEPFFAYPDKWVIVLAVTSNRSASDFQFSPSNAPLYQSVIRQSMSWASKDRLMFVVGATQADRLSEVRQLAPDHFLLVPGVGAQGGSLTEVAQHGCNKSCGLIVNSSRGIIFASNSDDFAQAAANKAHQIQSEMERLLTDNSL